MKRIWKSTLTSVARSGRSRLARDFLMWPTYLAIGLFLLFVALFVIPRSRVLLLFFGMPVIAIATLIPIAISCVVTAASLKRQRYLRALSALVLPVLCTIAAVNYGSTLKTCGAAADYVQFYVGYPFFAHAVSQLSRNNGPLLKQPVAKDRNGSNSVIECQIVPPFHGNDGPADPRHSMLLLRCARSHRLLLRLVRRYAFACTSRNHRAKNGSSRR
jgi:hypothetical protein